MKVFLLILLFMVNCQTKNEPQPNEVIQPDIPTDELQAQFDLYLQLSADTLDEKSWLTDTKCDGLLFNSIYAIVGGESDPMLAESDDEPGKFFRHHSKSCFDTGGSTSECSRDMYVGLMLFLAINGDADAIKRIADHGEKNALFEPFLWQMCRGPIGQVDFRPNIIGTVYHLSFKLGGEDRVERSFSQSWSKKCNGFECHVQVVHLLSRAVVDKGIGDKELDFLAHLANTRKDNALFNGLYGRFSGKKEYLFQAYQSVKKYCPVDRLPASSDRRSFYLWEREPDGDSYKPGEPGKIFSGTDCLFALAVLLEKIPFK